MGIDRTFDMSITARTFDFADLKNHPSKCDLYKSNIIILQYYKNRNNWNSFSRFNLNDNNPK